MSAKAFKTIHSDHEAILLNSLKVLGTRIKYLYLSGVRRVKPRLARTLANTGLSHSTLGVLVGLTSSWKYFFVDRLKYSKK